MNETILNHIRQIHWQELGADEVPARLINLMDSDREVRLDAQRWLDEKYINAGMVAWEDPAPLSAIFQTEIPMLIAPLLIEMLQDAKIPNRYMVLVILATLVSNIYWGIEEAGEPYRSRAFQVWNKVSESIEVFEDFLNDTDPHIKMRAQEMLNFLKSEQFPAQDELN